VSHFSRQQKRVYAAGSEHLMGPQLLREVSPWHYLHVQGTECLPGEPGETGKLNRRTHLAVFGCSGLLWLEKNVFFRTCYPKG